ncbi:glycosyltransferase family 2 protein, partial [Acidianus sp. RZ1]|uniref:glycosyltransferase n=1 Tax=Acidianus sp. RZ1 TaxID=1540082 RepID=UPI001492393E
MPIIDILLQLLIFIIPSLTLGYQLFLFRVGSKIREPEDDISKYPSLSIIVPTKGEKVEIIQGLIDNLDKIYWEKEKMEIIIVSDDDEKYFEVIKDSLRIPAELHVRLFRRERKLGFKSGALAYGYEKASGDLIVTLDVDARLRNDSLKRAYAHMLKFGCDAVTMNWIGYTRNNFSLLAKGLMVSTIIGDNSILTGRYKSNLKVFPVGCGTLYKRSAIQEIGPWDYRMIQDDLEIGTRLIKHGKRICSSDSPVFVEVP